MIKDDFISTVIAKTREKMTGVDHDHLRIIMEGRSLTDTSLR